MIIIQHYENDTSLWVTHVNKGEDRFDHVRDTNMRVTPYKNDQGFLDKLALYRSYWLYFLDDEHMTEEL